MAKHALVETHLAVAVGRDLLEVGFVVLDAGHHKGLERAMARELHPLGLVVAAGVAAQVRRKLDGTALRALAAKELALGNAVVELLNDWLHVFKKHRVPPLGCLDARRALVVGAQDLAADVLAATKAAQERGLWSLGHLRGTGLAAHLLDGLDHVRHARGSVRMTKVAAAAVRVDGPVTVKAHAAVDGVLPGLAARDVANLLGGHNVSCQEEVIHEEQVKLVGAHAGELVDLLGANLGAVVLVVRGRALEGGSTRAQDVNHLVVEAAGDGHLGGHDHQGGGAVALNLEAGHAQVLRNLGVAKALEVRIGIRKVVLLGKLLEGLRREGQGVENGVAPQGLGDAVQGIVDLLCREVVLPAVLVDPVVERDAKRRVKRAAIGAVVDLGDGGQHLGEREVAAEAAGGVYHGKRRRQVHGTRKHNVIGAGGNRLHCLLQGNVTGAAGLGVVHRANAAHAEPVRHLHVGREGVANHEGVRGTVVEVLDVARLEARVLDGLKRGVAKGVALAHALGLGMVLEVLEGSAANTHDGHAACLLAKLDQDNHSFARVLQNSRCVRAQDMGCLTCRAGHIYTMCPAIWDTQWACVSSRR